MAEGLFRRILSDSGRSDAYEVDSSGTAAWHVGKAPDPRTLEVLARHDALCPMRARQVADTDFETFDLILAMDRANLDDLRRRCPAEHRHKLHLALEPTTGGDVPDPYYGGPGGFDDVYGMLDAALRAWLARLEA